jgi:hypothetical protein
MGVQSDSRKPVKPPVYKGLRFAIIITGSRLLVFNEGPIVCTDRPFEFEPEIIPPEESSRLGLPRLLPSFLTC